MSSSDDILNEISSAVKVAQAFAPEAAVVTAILPQATPIVAVMSAAEPFILNAIAIIQSVEGKSFGDALLSVLKQVTPGQPGAPSLGLTAHPSPLTAVQAAQTGTNSA